MTKQDIMEIFKITEAEADEIIQLGEKQEADNWKWIEKNWIKE